MAVSVALGEILIKLDAVAVNVAAALKLDESVFREEGEMVAASTEALGVKVVVDWGLTEAALL